MKRAILSSLVALVTGPLLVLAAVDGDDSVVELEKKAWDIYKNREGDAYKALCAPTYTGIYDVGVKDAQKEVADMNDIELRGQSVDGLFPPTEPIEEFPPRRVGDGEEHIRVRKPPCHGDDIN